MIRIFGILVILGICANSAWSSGGEETVEMVSFFSSNFLWTVINFVLVAFLLVKFGKAPMTEALRARKERIERSMNDASEARAAAEKALKETERRLAEKDSTVKTIVDEAREAAERERQSLAEQGETAARDIVERARVSVDVEYKKALDNLRAEAVKLAMEAAEQKIGNRMTAEDQNRLVSQYITGMENRN